MNVSQRRTAARVVAARVAAGVALAGVPVLLVLRARRRRGEMEGEDVVDLLARRHREAEALIDACQDPSAHPEARAHTLATLSRRLCIHEAVEEQLVHPLVRRHLPHGHRLAAQVLGQEQEAKRLLAALQDAEPGSPATDELSGRLFEGVRAHAQAEETTVFPLLRLHLGARERMRLGAMVERAERFAPTHPHPHAPSQGSGVVGMPVVGVLDRARDRVRHTSSP